jgi:hypothetical protein
MDISETQPPPSSPPYCARSHDPAPAQNLRAKRKPKLTNEGRDPGQDKKRVRKHGTLPRSRRASGKSASYPTSLYWHPTIKPIHMTAATSLEGSSEPRKSRTSHAPPHLTPGVPVSTSTKLVFPPPRLQLPLATKTASIRPLPPSRRSAYERLHGGPHFKIYEDKPPTDKLFSLSSGYSFFPWSPAPARFRSGIGNAEQDQENDPSFTIPIPDLTVREYAPRPTTTAVGDAAVIQGRSMKAKHQVSKQSLQILRMMR